MPALPYSPGKVAPGKVALGCIVLEKAEVAFRLCASPWTRCDAVDFCVAFMPRVTLSELDGEIRSSGRLRADE